MTKKYEGITLAADVVIVVGRKVLMLKRQIYPFEGYWILPGGKVEEGELVEDAAKREAWEETGIKPKEVELIGVYSDPERDPRGHVVCCGYFSKLSKEEDVVLNDEADDYRFFDIDNIPEEIGFDHKKIIEDAKNKFLNEEGL